MKTNIIFGPPGTGKTTKLLNIMEDLLKKYSPEEIAYVTFTKEGAEQGKTRAKQKFNLKKENMYYFSTLHSLAFRSLKINRLDMMQRKHYKIFSDKVGMSFTGYYTEEFYNNDDKYLFFDETYRNNPTCAKNYLHSLDAYKIKYVRENYKKFKQTYNLLDFTDLIEKFVNNNNSIPVKVAIIDEAQDLTTLQWRMVWTAFKNCNEIYIAGDDDQAIYQWSGADIKYFLSIKGDIEVLNRSYRLPDNILEFSKRITNQIEHRIYKKYNGIGNDGIIDIITSLDELDFGNGETWMLLARNNVFLRQIEEYMQNKGLLYKLKRVSSAMEKDYEYIKLFENIRKTRIMTERQEYDFKPILKDKINYNLPWYANFNWQKNKIDYFRNIIGNKNFNWDDIRIKIGTIHSVKGDEADNVVLLTDITKNVKNNLDRNPDSEHRVFYVGCTRAKKNLYIRESKTKNNYIIY